MKLRTWFLLPARLCMAVLFAAPFLIVLAYSFLTRGSFGGIALPWNGENYQRLFDSLYLTILGRSFLMAGGATAICFLRDVATNDEEHIDEPSWGDLVAGKMTDLTRIAVEPRGIFSLQLAIGPQGRIGVAWQAQQEDDTAISFASVSCPVVAAAPAPK